jgi:DNA-binding XRE family transcriptional regulator
MLVSLRDEEGNIDRTSRVLDEAMGLDGIEVRGRRYRPGVRYFDINGTELPLSRHPAELAHRSGQAQGNVTIGVARSSGTTRWLRTTYVPLTQGPIGWSVLGIGMDATPLATGEFSIASDPIWLGASLRSRRQAIHMSQGELGAAAGLSQATISNYEKGRREIPLHVFVTLCHILDIPPLSLMTS